MSVGFKAEIFDEVFYLILSTFFCVCLLRFSPAKQGIIISKAEEA